MSDDNIGTEAPVVDAPVVENPAEEPAAEVVDAPEGTPEADPTDSPDGDEGEDLSDDFVDDDSDPETNQRKSAKDYIIQRKEKKIKKLEAAAAAGAEGDDPDDPDAVPAEMPEGDDPDDDNPLAGLAPIIESHVATQDAQEVSKFLDEHPDFKPYRAKVERWMKHPARRSLPVSTIFFEVAGNDMMKMGAERERNAVAKAKNTKSGGGSNRDAMAPTDWSKATPAELETEKQRVRQTSRR